MKKYIISVVLIVVSLISVVFIDNVNENINLEENYDYILENENIIEDLDEYVQEIPVIDEIIEENDEIIVNNNIEIIDEVENNITDTIKVENIEKNVYISISCDTILKNLEDFPENKLSLVPTNGTILQKTTVEIADGDSVFDVLLNVTKDKKIHMEFVSTPIYGSAYIEGINNIYEFDCGDLSGWMYRVNGVVPTIGISGYILNENDVIEILYSCDLGKDLN